jgi:hypothetical protein
MPSRQNDHAQPADAIAMLKADHQRVKDLFAHYEATSNLDTKRALAEHVFLSNRKPTGSSPVNRGHEHQRFSTYTAPDGRSQHT